MIKAKRTPKTHHSLLISQFISKTKGLGENLTLARDRAGIFAKGEHQEKLKDYVLIPM